MYSPENYREYRFNVIAKLIEEYGFATLLSEDQISHLPMILNGDNANPLLLSHMARANPHWRQLQTYSKCKVIFVGPHRYISPAWYEPAKDNVPTWNYATVHAEGNFQLVEDPKEAFGIMKALVEKFERDNETSWKLPEDEAAINGLMKAIVVFRIINLKFEAKFKLSQMQEAVNRENVIEELIKLRNTEASKLANYMERASPKKVT